MTTSTNPAILLTGRPGVGKTIVIKKVVSLPREKAGGFYTRETRVKGKRTGLEIVSLTGQTGYLATKDSDIIFANEVPFGQYRVNLEAINSIGVPTLFKAMRQDKIVVVDEIGPMEILSERYCQTVLGILDSQVTVVGTIVQRPNVFSDQVKRHIQG